MIGGQKGKKARNSKFSAIKYQKFEAEISIKAKRSSRLRESGENPLLPRNCDPRISALIKRATARLVQGWAAWWEGDGGGESQETWPAAVVAAPQRGMGWQVRCLYDSFLPLLGI